ncbi:hypothetical protein L5515_015085 [Caenorhabditis briggsae]|uniref:Uncharacterized protein n=1 Tax=Caenorhabditis briggsae TaxID=6238 RepID=A0AAE9J7Q2_CAEBR|nr:hypothetical protein L3Y34_018960 [Caenorhabditis briggsae]UMM19524.1 hypothetical protein L5515_015085 [Caenorhabditis briggsae]
MHQNLNVSSTIPIVKHGNGFRSEWEKMTTYKLIILLGGVFWAAFLLAFGLYNYCAIKKPPPPVSFDEALCAEEEALMGTKSQKSSKDGSATKSSMSMRK